MKIRAILPWAVVIGLSLAPAAMAQAGASSTPATMASGPTKVVVLDVRAAIVNTAEGKQAQAQLQSQFSSQVANIDKIGKEIEAIEKRAQAGANTLSAEEQAKMQRQHDLLQKQYQRATEEYQDETNAAQAEVLDGIGRKLVDMVDRYARENGVGLVIDSSSQQTPVLYRAQQVDISQEIVKLYDLQYPVKAAATTPAPKPSTPATPPAKKPGGPGQN